MNSAAHPDKFEFALQNGKKYIRNESDNLWKVNPDVFESDDVAHREVFNRISKHLKVGQKYTGPRLAFKTLLVRVFSTKSHPISHI